MDAFTPLAPYFVSSLKSRHPLRFFMKKETLRCDSRESIASRFIEPANNDCGLGCCAKNRTYRLVKW